MDTTETRAGFKRGERIPNVRAFVEFVLRSRSADLIVLGEFSLRWALPAWVVTRFRRQVFVVDFFVGSFETAIGDWRRHSPRSPQAYFHLFVDRIAIACGDFVITDTAFRRDAIRRQFKKRCVYHVPVGAPGWAHEPTQALTNTDKPVDFLWYGNYLPLHGCELLIRAFGQHKNKAFRLVMLGDGEQRGAIEKLVDSLDLSHCVSFVEPVAESSLAEWIWRADYVLGIFGSSEKAQTVIANKVWQGLACGKPVVTRASVALDEIRGLVPGQLICPDNDDVDALAETVSACLVGLHPPAFEGSSVRLEKYVERVFEQTWNALVASVDDDHHPVWRRMRRRARPGRIPGSCGVTEE